MTLTEARLPDLLIDLHDQYGFASPKPRGMVVEFTVIHENTTYDNAVKSIDALLTLHGLAASSMSITPGPQGKKKWNFKVVFTVAKDLLM